MRVRHGQTNAFIVLFLLLAFIDTMPEYLLRHRPLKAAIDPIMDVTGWWQGTWELFSPQADSTNHHLEVEFVREDGAIATLRSPDWAEASSWEKFHRFREMEFLDSLPRRPQPIVRRSYIHHLLAEERPPEATRDATITSVRLIKVSQSIPDPGTQTTGPEERTILLQEELHP